MNRKKRILQQDQSHNENHEDRVNMPHHLNGTFDVQQHYPSSNLFSNNVVNPIMLNTQIDDKTRKKGKSVMIDKSLNKKVLSYNDMAYTHLDHSMAHKQVPYNQYHLASHASGTNINMLMHQPPIRATQNISSFPITCKLLNTKSFSCRKKYVSYCCIMFY